MAKKKAEKVTLGKENASGLIHKINPSQEEEVIFEDCSTE